MMTPIRILHTIPGMTIALVFLLFAGVPGAYADDDTFDDSIYVGRSNVVSSMVDPSFWEEREPLTIAKLDKPLTLPGRNTKPVAPDVCPQGSNLDDRVLSVQELAIMADAQDMALVLVNNPYYQAGDKVFKLDDKTQVLVSSVKYAATGEYYGRTDLSSAWVTEFYNAAYCDDSVNVTALLEELPAEV